MPTTTKTKTETVAKPPKVKEIDPLELEDVPGIGPIGKKALLREGYENTWMVVKKTPTWLKDVTNMDRDKANEAFMFMKKNLIKAGYLQSQEMTATELGHMREKIQRISTGCNAFDHLIDGGIECRSMTEVYGENGSGKTQLGHVLAIQVQRPVVEGGLLEDGKPPPMVLYIDTENTCRPERLTSILIGKKMIVDFPKALKTKIEKHEILDLDELSLQKKILEQQTKEKERYTDHIIVRKASDAVQQIEIIKWAVKAVQHLPIRLIIVDSMTAQFRTDYLGRGNTKTKFDLLNEMAHDLKAIAEDHNIAVLAVNQIYHKPDDSFGADPTIPYGGNVWGHMVPYRLKIEKSGTKKKLTLKKSPYQPESQCRFDITEAGLVDLEAK